MKRLPRPQGATYLSKRYQETGTNEDKEKLYNHLISMYTMQGFRWNGKPTSIPELSSILKIPSEKIMESVSNVGQNMGSLATPQNINNTLESIITLATSWSLEDRGRVAQQVDILLHSQDGKYKPFISSEVTKALKLLLESNKNLMETYKTFFTSTTNVTNILQVLGKGNEEDKDYLSPDDALSIILGQDKHHVNQPALPDNQGRRAESETSMLADKLYQDYGIGDFETVQENRTGTHALLPKGPKSLEAEGPSSHPAQSAEHAADGGFKRRGLDIEDVDELPTS